MRDLHGMPNYRPFGLTDHVGLLAEDYALGQEAEAVYTQGVQTKAPTAPHAMYIDQENGQYGFARFRKTQPIAIYPLYEKLWTAENQTGSALGTLTETGFVQKLATGKNKLSQLLEGLANLRRMGTSVAQ